jgi:uncharacterized protein (TIGR02996 family)
MRHHPSFLQAILEAPDDDTPRLVYADWLEEHGDAAEQVRAEFIRVQVELARIPGDDPRRPALEMRQEELLAAHEAEWLLEVRKRARRGATFRRGFIEEIECDCLAIERGAKTLDSMIPLRRLRIYGDPSRPTQAIISSPALSRITFLWLRCFYSVDVDRMLEAPQIGSLTGFGLSACDFNMFELHGWLSHEKLERATELFLGSERSLSSRGDHLFSSPECSRLTKLDFSLCPFDTVYLRDLLTSPHCGLLTSLDFMLNFRLQDPRATLLADCPKLTNLAFLSLDGCGITDDGLRELARSPYLPSLTDLILSTNAVTDAGIRALIDSPNLPRLARIELFRTRADGSGMKIWEHFRPPNHNRRCVWVQQERQR